MIGFTVSDPLQAGIRYANWGVQIAEEELEKVHHAPKGEAAKPLPAQIFVSIGNEG